MAKKSIKVQATASVANVSCGFDCIGYAISDPSDLLTIEKQNKPGVEITISGSNTNSIPTNSEKNTAGKAILSLLNALKCDQGFKVHIEKGIPPGSGLGSSAASAAAAVIGVNELLDNPFELDDLLIHGIAGEAVASGGFHADNIAPALFGGMILILSYDPLDILQLSVPEKLISTTVLPEFTINTLEARNMLPGPDVINRLGQKTSYIDGIGRTQGVPPIQTLIKEGFLDHALTVIKSALYFQSSDISTNSG